MLYERSVGSSTPVQRSKERVPLDERTLLYMAHELRNALDPLREAVLFMLQRNSSLGSDDVLAEQLTTMLHQVDHASALVERHEAFTWLHHAAVPLKRQRLDLTGLAKQVIDGFALGAPELTLFLAAPQTVWLDADPLHIEQVLSNLIDNAVRFSPVGGTVVVRVWQDHQRACCAVSDEGPGIPHALYEQIFQPCRQPDNQPSQSVGLGLAISSTITRRYGGDLWLHTSSAQGTEFRFWMPVAAQTAR